MTTNILTNIPVCLSSPRISDRLSRFTVSVLLVILGGEGVLPFLVLNLHSFERSRAVPIKSPQLDRSRAVPISRAQNKEDNDGIRRFLQKFLQEL